MFFTVVTPLHGQNRYAKLTEFDRELQVGLTYVKPSVVQLKTDSIKNNKNKNKIFLRCHCACKTTVTRG